MSKHTPGPWKAVYVGCSDWDLNGPVTKEDWTLAAAAPELLEALKFYGSSCDATESTPCGYEGNLCCKRARAAIARAEGEKG